MGWEYPQDQWGSLIINILYDLHMYYIHDLANCQYDSWEGFNGKEFK